MATEQIEINTEAEMLCLGEHVSEVLRKQILSGVEPSCIVYLRGDLGVGKTTLVKGIVRGLGYDGVVTSPTYTLVENYSFAELNVFHFDLYRLKSAEELEFLGLRDMLVEPVLVLVEWPENGESVLPVACYEINFKMSENGRELTLPTSFSTEFSFALENSEL